MQSELYNFIIEQRDVSKIEKLITLTDPETFWDDVRRFTRNVTSDHAIRRWQGLAEIRFDEVLLASAGSINYKGFSIRKTWKGFMISNSNGQDMRRCDSITECKHRINWEEV